MLHLSTVCGLNQLAFNGCNDFSNTPCVISNSCTRLQLNGCVAPPREVCDEVDSSTKFVVFMAAAHAVVNTLASGLWLYLCFQQEEASVLNQATSKAVVPSPIKANGGTLQEAHDMRESLNRLQEDGTKTQALLEEHKTLLAYYGKLLGINDIEKLTRSREEMIGTQAMSISAQGRGEETEVSGNEAREHSSVENAVRTETFESDEAKDTIDEAGLEKASPQRRRQRRHRRLELSDDDL